MLEFYGLGGITEYVELLGNAATIPEIDVLYPKVIQTGI